MLETNTAFANSGITHRLELVKAHEVAYSEPTSFSEMLLALRESDDGKLDEVHELRDMYGADLVSMVVAGSQYCGLGYLMVNPNPGFANYAFSVVARGCATGYYSFAHELGHNLGCQHDHNQGGSGAFDYSFGHHGPNQSWRTIMAYAPGTRIPHFSNPSVMHQGSPTGVVSAMSNAADNALTINQTSLVAEGFRDAGVYSFGAGKESSEGLVPAISWSGRPEVGENQFEVEVMDAIGDSYALVLRGGIHDPHTFFGGTLYFAQPFQRVGLFQTNLDGSGQIAIDIESASIGATDYYQVVFRDERHPDDTGIGITNALKVTYVP